MSDFVSGRWSAKLSTRGSSEDGPPSGGRDFGSGTLKVLRGRDGRLPRRQTTDLSAACPPQTAGGFVSIFFFFLCVRNGGAFGAAKQGAVCQTHLPGCVVIGRRDGGGEAWHAPAEHRVRLLEGARDRRRAATVLA